MQSPSWWCMPCSAKMDAREKGSGRWSDMWCLLLTFPNSSGWWWLISSMFLSRTSCHKTTHANSYYGAWPGWAVSVSMLPLTVLGQEVLVRNTELISHHQLEGQKETPHVQQPPRDGALSLASILVEQHVHHQEGL